MSNCCYNCRRYKCDKKRCDYGINSNDKLCLMYESDIKPPLDKKEVVKIIQQNSIDFILTMSERNLKLYQKVIIKCLMNDRKKSKEGINNE